MPSAVDQARFFNQAGRIMAPAALLEAPAGSRRAGAGDARLAVELQAKLDRLPAHVQESLMRSMIEILGATSDRLAAEVARAEPISAGERAALERLGIDSDAPAAVEPAARATVLRSALLAASAPLKEVAERAGVSDARLRQRIGEGSLLAIKGVRGWLIPLFQFPNGREVPGLGRVLRSIRPDASVVLKASFLTTPQPELADEADALLAPLDWLAQGRDPGPVLEAAQEI